MQQGDKKHRSISHRVYQHLHATPHGYFAIRFFAFLPSLFASAAALFLLLFLMHPVRRSRSRFSLPCIFTPHNSAQSCKMPLPLRILCASFLLPFSCTSLVFFFYSPLHFLPLFPIFCSVVHSGIFIIFFCSLPCSDFLIAKKNCTKCACNGNEINSDGIASASCRSNGVASTYTHTHTHTEAHTDRSVCYYIKLEATASGIC